MVTLNKLGEPLIALLPVKVTVPADAVKLPETSNNTLTEKLAAVEMELPVATFKVLNEMVPPPVIVLLLPVNVTTPALVAKLPPVTARLPAIVKEVVLLIVPVTVRLLKIIPVPEIVFDVPDMVSIPAPSKCVNSDDPVVARLPAIFRLVEAAAVQPVAEKVRL